VRGPEHLAVEVAAGGEVVVVEIGKMGRL